MTTTVWNIKISEVKNKTPSTSSSLVTKTVLNTKVSDVGNRVRNHDKYITNLAFIKLTAATLEED